MTNPSDIDIQEALAREKYLRDNNLRLDEYGKEKKIEGPAIVKPVNEGHFAMVACCKECGEELRRLSDTMNEDGSIRVNLLCPRCFTNAPKKLDQCEPRERPEDD